MNKILITLIQIILIFNIYGCEGLTTSPDSSGNKSETPKYVPGQVVAGFADTVSHNLMINFFDSLSLEILNFDLGHNFWAIADSNDLEFYQEIFSNESTVEFVNKLYSGSTDDTLKITITFNGINTIESDLKKVKSVGLNVYEIHEHPKSVLLRTATGKEKYWISQLIAYDFVEFAELNYINHAH